jgi:hypothetical protein
VLSDQHRRNVRLHPVDAAADHARPTDSMAGAAAEPFGAYLFGPGDPRARLARQLEREVFLEAFGNTTDLLAAEYGPYEESSLFICIVDHLLGRPAGMMRVLLPSPAGLKSINDLEAVWGESADVVVARTDLDIDLERTLDVATLALAPDYRGGAAQGVVSMGLYQALTRMAGHYGMDWFIAILDLPVYRLLRWKLRMIFKGFEGVAPRPYLGSPASVPAWCHVSAAAQHLHEVDPTLYEVLVLGIGLEPALRPLELSEAPLPRAVPAPAAGA